MIKDYIIVLRPQQWNKNLFCYAGLFFGIRGLENLNAWVLSTFLFIVFCGLSSSLYVLNDIIDREKDRAHPKKQFRPIARGAVPVPNALGLGIVLFGLSIWGACYLGSVVFWAVLLYALNNILYTFWLKHWAIVDCMSIAFGFIFRLLAGIYVIGQFPTAWILVCTFFLALFLVFAKRYSELCNTKKFDQRPVLDYYSMPFLRSLLNGTANMAIISYALFTIESDKSSLLIITIPIVFFAIAHYKRLVMVLEKGEEPEVILMKDWKMQVAIALWLVSYFVIEWFNLSTTLY